MPIEEFESNIKTIIAEARKCTNNVLLLGFTRAQTKDSIPFSWKENKYYDNRTINKYDKKLKEICKEEKVHYFSLSKLIKKCEYKDGLHPDNNGHEAISKNL